MIPQRIASTLQQFLSLRRFDPTQTALGFVQKATSSNCYAQSAVQAMVRMADSLVDIRQGAASILLSTSEGRPNGEPDRTPAGDTGPADPENTGARADAWLGHCPAYPADLTGSAPGRAGIAVSRSASSGATRMDWSRVEHL